MLNLQNFLTALSLLIGAVCFYVTWRRLSEYVATPWITVGKKQRNNDLMAIEQSVSLAREAEEEIEIFDDGDISTEYESLYNDPTFVGVVKDKLANNSNFKVRAFFNDGHPELLFIQELLENKNQVEIYRLKPEIDRPLDVHYRLIDGGVKGVLVKHGKGVGERILQRLGCFASVKKEIWLRLEGLF